MFRTGLEELLEKVALAMTNPAHPPSGNWHPLTPQPAAPAAKPGLLRQMALPAALGGAAALGLGMHHQYEQDQQKHPLVYAPLQGSMF